MTFDLFDGLGTAAPDPDLTIPDLAEGTQRELFRLAYEVREIEPWKGFVDHEWFGIVDPDTGETQIVSILGAAGQVFAIQLYLPEEGIRFWNHILATGELDQGMARFDQRMIECEFCDRSDLPEEDQEFNDRFPPSGARKRKAGYICFRAYRPEHHPWFLEEEEAHRIELALRLVKPFCAHMKDHGESYYLTDLASGMPAIPLFRLRKGGTREKAADWKIHRDSFPVAEPKQVPDPPRDDVFHARMEKFTIKPGTTWEVGSFFIPAPVADQGRPVYSTMSMTGVLEGDHAPMPLIGMPSDCRIGNLRKSFAGAVEEWGYLPETLLVASPLAEVAFAGLADQSGIVVQAVEELPGLGNFAREFASFMEQGAAGNFNLDGLLEGEDLPFDDGPAPAYPVPSSATRYVMRIDLAGATPPIWRRISLPIDANFFDLHVAIQEAMGWGDEHLHMFEVKKGRKTLLSIELDNDPNDDLQLPSGMERLSELDSTLQDVVERGHKKIRYLYDFGDSWDHMIQIEKTVEGKKAHPLPKLIAGSGACPLEDSGGIWGYQALLQGDPNFTGEWEEEDLEKLRNAKFVKSKVKFSSPAESLARINFMRGF